MAANIKYFCDTTELKNTFTVDRKVAIKTWSYLSIKRYSYYDRIVGHPIDGSDAIYPVTRIIEYKKNPSLHKCDARCRNAKGNQCECSCGGKYHGASG